MYTRVSEGFVGWKDYCLVHPIWTMDSGPEAHLKAVNEYIPLDRLE